MKNIQNFMMSVFGISIGFISVLIVLMIKEQNVSKSNQVAFYTYEGFEDYSIENRDSGYFYAYNRQPRSVRVIKKTKVPIIEKPENAAKIGISILISKFGESYIMKQAPFTVVLINHKVWKVSGNAEEWDRPSAIYIQAADGEILGIYGQK